MKTFDEAAHAKATELANTVIRKQNDYGPKNITNTPINPVLAIMVRINDKIQRMTNLVQSGKEPQNESIQDTALDIMGYGLVLAMLLDGTFTLPLETKSVEISANTSNFMINNRKMFEAMESFSDKAYKKKRATTVAEKELVINRLHNLWIANPDLRLSQLILNVFTKDFYYVEDEAFIDDLENFYETK